MRKKITSGFICLQDDYRLIYRIARIDYTEWEDGNFSYAFYPFYNVIDMISSRLFQGIPGLDLSLRESVYVRKNMVPTFIAERTPGEGREDVWSLMEECGMKTINRLEWLMRTKTRYSGDRLFVVPAEGNEVTTYQEQSINDLVKRSDSILKKMLDIICFGDKLYLNDIVIDDNTRAQLYPVLLELYKYEYKRKRESQMRGIIEARKRNAYKGRGRIAIDPLLFDKVANDYMNGRITAYKASSLLGMSYSTFFRRLHERK